MSLAQKMAPHADIWRRAALLGLLCVTLGAIATSETLHSILLSALSESKDVIEHYPTAGGFLFVFCAALSAMLAFVSVAVIVPIAVFSWGAPASLLLLWVGWIVGGALSFVAGRAFGRPMLRWAGTSARLQKFESYVHRDMPFFVVLLFQAAVPSEIPGYLLGAVGYRFDRYLLALAIVELPFAAATILLSESLVAKRALTLLVGRSAADRCEHRCNSFAEATVVGRTRPGLDSYANAGVGRSSMPIVFSGTIETLWLSHRERRLSIQ
jgi:uncharacterized membrane protein YdjX (TVP38/TMEM64 family)